MRVNRVMEMPNNNTFVRNDGSILSVLLGDLAKRFVTKVAGDVVDSVESYIDDKTDFKHLFFDDNTINTEPTGYIENGKRKVKVIDMKPIIICDGGKDGLKKLLKEMKGSKDAIVVNCSYKLDNLKKLVSKKNIIYGQHLVPSPKVMNYYYEDGFGNEYLKAYIKQLSKPDIAYFLNIIIARYLASDSNLVFACGKDEAEFKYLKMLKERIIDFYDLKVVSSKKYLDGETKVKYSDEKLNRIREMTKKLHNDLYYKLSDSCIDISYF